MTKLFFRIGAERFEAGEVVYHPGCRQFAKVDGISGSSVELVQRNGAAYFADPATLRRHAESARAYYDALANVDRGLARWFLDTWASGVSLDDCQGRLRTAFVIVEAERAATAGENEDGCPTCAASAETRPLPCDECGALDDDE